MTWKTVQKLMRVGYTSEGDGCAGTNLAQNVDQTDKQHSLVYCSLIRNIFALHGLAESCEPPSSHGPGSVIADQKTFLHISRRQGKRRRKEGEKKRARRGHTALSLLWSFGE